MGCFLLLRYSTTTTVQFTTQINLKIPTNLLPGPPTNKPYTPTIQQITQTPVDLNRDICGCVHLHHPLKDNADTMTNSADASLRKVTPDLKLLDLTLKNASAIQHSLMGEFTSTGSQEILVARPGGAIEVHKIESSDDDDEDEESRVWLKMVMRVETRSVIRSIEIVRLSGEKRDLVIIGSDSGNVSVMDFEGGKSKILHCPAFGKTG